MASSSQEEVDQSKKRKTPERKESTKKSKRRKTEATDAKNSTATPTVEFTLCSTPPPKWENVTGDGQGGWKPLTKLQIFAVDLRHRETNERKLFKGGDYGRIEVRNEIGTFQYEETPIPRSIDVKNNPTNLKLAARMKRLVDKGCMARAFIHHRFGADELVLAFAGTPEEEAAALTKQNEVRKAEIRSILETLRCMHPDAPEMNDTITRAERLMPPDLERRWVPRFRKVVLDDFNAFCQEHWNVE